MIRAKRKIFKITPGLLLLVSVSLMGCLPQVPPPSAPGDSVRRQPYRSQLAAPGAKALFAFGQFRLLAADGRWDEAIAALERAVAFDPDTPLLQFVLAKAYLHVEQVDRAGETLKGLLQANPDYVPAHELLGDIYVYQKDFGAAVVHFRKAFDLEPERSSVQMRLGVALERSGDVAAAVDVFEEMLKERPQSVMVRLTLARIYAGADQQDKALLTYRELLDRKPGHQQAALEYGRLLARKDENAAIDFYLETLESHPEAAAVRQQLAQLYLTHNELTPALEQFKVIGRQYPDNLQIVGRIALIELELRHWPDAEQGFRRLLTIEEHRDRNRYYLAMALAGQSKFSEAVSELELIGPQAANYTDAALQRAYLLNQAGETDRAIEVLRKLLEDDHRRTEVYFYLAAFLGERDRYDQALEILKEAVTTYPDDVRLLYQLGVVYEKTGAGVAAVETMEKIIAVDDHHADALNFLAYYQAENRSDLDLALERARTAYRLKPSGYIADTLGWVYYMRGEYEQGRVYLEEAAREIPDDAVIREHLGDLYRSLGQFGKAAQSYRRALELDPSAAGVKEKLKQLEGESER